MVFQVPQNFDIAIDGFQILLCLLILGLYIKNRAIHKKLAVCKIKNGAGQSFNAHVFNRIVKQQVDQALTNILETIAAERNGLKSVLGLTPLSSGDDAISKVQFNSQLPNSHDNQRTSDDRSGSAGRHEKVLKFSAKGLSARKISEVLKMPMGEVELILSLQKK
jgi:hypothetical protein